MSECLVSSSSEFHWVDVLVVFLWVGGVHGAVVSKMSECGVPLRFPVATFKWRAYAWSRC